MVLDHGLGGWNCRHSMFPYYEGTTRAYTDDELEELKPNKKNDIMSPYIRENVSQGYNINKEKQEIENAINMIKDKKVSLAKELNDKVEFEIISKDSTNANYSRCDAKNKKIYIYQEADKYEVIHEIGHLVEDINMKYSKPYQRLKQKLVDNSTISFISRDNRIVYALKNNMFIDEYQGYLHIRNISNIHEIDTVTKCKYATEIFSESFREYFQNPNNLKNRMPEMYNLIEEMLK